VLRHCGEMCRHTFRGSTWRTWLGLESEREAFKRYRAIRRAEREYLPPEDTTPLGSSIGERVQLPA
jgi:hypothetical protein